jgi:hypothetical protein
MDDDISLTQVLDEITALLTSNGIGIETIEPGPEPDQIELFFENGQLMRLTIEEAQSAQKVGEDLRSSE